MLRQPLLYWLSKHPVFWFTLTHNTVSPATNGYLPVTVQLLCDLRDTMPRHWSSGASHPGHQVLPTPRRFPPQLASSLTLPWTIARFLDHSLTCDLQDTMPRQRSLTLIPREAEDFPSVDNHSKHVSLPIYIAWLQPVYYNSRFCIYTCQY